MESGGFNGIRSRKAFTLVELIIATLILSMLMVTCAGVILSTYGAFSVDKNTYIAAQEASRIREDLKNYVTDDTSVTLNAPGSPPWHLPEDVSCVNCWALASGAHDVSGRLPAKMRQDYGATMFYTVQVVPYQGRELRDVSINVNWDPGTK